jgi:hypothetical protein
LDVGDLGLRFPQLLAKIVDRLVTGDFPRGARDRTGDLGVPLGQDLLSPVKLACLTFASRARLSLVKAPSVCRGSPASSRAMAARSFASVAADTGIRDRLRSP